MRISKMELDDLSILCLSLQNCKRDSMQFWVAVNARLTEMSDDISTRNYSMLVFSLQRSGYINE